MGTHHAKHDIYINILLDIYEEVHINCIQQNILMRNVKMFLYSNNQVDSFQTFFLLLFKWHLIRIQVLKSDRNTEDEAEWQWISRGSEAFVQ